MIVRSLKFTFDLDLSFNLDFFNKVNLLLPNYLDIQSDKIVTTINKINYGTTEVRENNNTIIIDFLEFYTDKQLNIFIDKILTFYNFHLVYFIKINTNDYSTKDVNNSFHIYSAINK